MLYLLLLVLLLYLLAVNSFWYSFVMPRPSQFKFRFLFFAASAAAVLLQTTSCIITKPRKKPREACNNSVKLIHCRWTRDEKVTTKRLGDSRCAIHLLCAILHAL